MNELCKKKIPKKFQDIQKSPKNLQNIFKNVQKIFFLLMDLSQSLMSGGEVRCWTPVNNGGGVVI